MLESTKRFSDRVNDYIQFRPSYPDKMIDYLQCERSLNHDSIIADIGSGTGILTHKILPLVKRVYGVEPNKAMREAAEKLLKEESRFVSIDGTSEHTGLPDHHIDLITAAQSFHWFDRKKTLNEFRRILKKSGMMVLIWNNRVHNTPFLRIYEELLCAHATDYNKINHQNITDSDIQACYTKEYQKVCFENHQVFNFKGVLGRLHSCSYAPKPHTSAYKTMEEALRKAFEKYAEEGTVRFNYRTEVYSGMI